VLLFRSVCHQVSNQADKLVLLAIFIISRRFARVVVKLNFVTVGNPWKKVVGHFYY